MRQSAKVKFCNPSGKIANNMRECVKKLDTPVSPFVASVAKHGFRLPWQACGPQPIDNSRAIRSKLEEELVLFDKELERYLELGVVEFVRLTTHL